MKEIKNDVTKKEKGKKLKIKERIEKGWKENKGQN